MASRYDKRRIFTNDNEIYDESLRNRGIKFIKHYETAKLRYPTAEEISELQLLGYTWSMEDRWWKVAAKYYGNSELWYILAWFNKKPTDFDVKVGETIYIPFPIEKILKFLGI